MMRLHESQNLLKVKKSDNIIQTSERVILKLKLMVVQIQEMLRRLLILLDNLQSKVIFLEVY